MRLFFKLQRKSSILYLLLVSHWNYEIFHFTTQFTSTYLQWRSTSNVHLGLMCAVQLGFYRHRHVSLFRNLHLRKTNSNVKTRQHWRTRQLFRKFFISIIVSIYSSLLLFKRNTSSQKSFWKSNSYRVSIGPSSDRYFSQFGFHLWITNLLLHERMVLIVVIR